MTLPEFQAPDPRGLHLWEERLQTIPSWLAGLSQEERPVLAPLGNHPVVTTGLGSSEAHARYFQRLCLNHELPCSFFATADFFRGDIPDSTEATLVVFSQGLSSNAQVALQKIEGFHRVLLFTAATVENLQEAGKPERAEFLKQLLDNGVEIWPLAPAEEFTLLIRCLGPLAGYWEVLRAAGHLIPEDSRFLPLPSSLEKELSCTLESGRDAGRQLTDIGAMIVFGETIHYSQNLSFKWIEGTFKQPPLVIDPLTFAHGPFQMLCSNSQDVLILRTESVADQELVEPVKKLCASLKGDLVEVISPWPDPLAILYFEHFLNGLVWQWFQSSEQSQIDWPGKGVDGPVYDINKPLQ